MLLAILQAAIFAVLCANHGYLRVRLFTIALALGSLENAVYDPNHFSPGLHIVNTTAWLLAGAEAIWIAMGDVPRHRWSYVGVGIAATAGIATFVQIEMQYNLALLLWRILGILWACVAIGAGLAVSGLWLSSLGPKWARLHGTIYAVYAAHQTTGHFSTPGKGQGTLWDLLWDIRTVIATCLLLAWLLLACEGSKVPDRLVQHECD